MPLSSRPGITRASLLVVAAIGVVFLGLLPPAILKVREASACVQCANNLKLVTLATRDANDTYGFVPSNPDTLGARPSCRLTG